MILVHLPQTWPDVVSGMSTAADVTLGRWALISDAAANTYGDVVLGIHQDEVVSAFDISGWSRDPADGRITFTGKPSTTWAHLIGDANPGKPWVRGQARPVQYLDTDAIRNGTVEPAAVEGGTAQRAVIGGFVLTVDADGNATLLTHAGAAVTIVSRSAA